MNENDKRNIGISNCPECKADEIVDGSIDNLFFDPGHKKWYKIILHGGIVLDHPAHCCAACGLVWMDLKVEDLKRFITTKCEIEFAKKIYKSFDLEDPGRALCRRCGSKRKIIGKLYSSGGRSGTLAFKPNHLIYYKYISVEYIQIRETSDCCADCGIVTAHSNPRELNRFLLKNCKPEYLKQIYSCHDNSDKND